ncbi:MAG: hypothetical protein RR690_08535 [Longicatena sp.]
MNKLRALRKENRQLVKKLDYINKPIYLDIVMYLLKSRLYAEKIEETQQDILCIMLDAQEQGISFDTKLGVHVKTFCDEIIQNSKRKTVFESVLEFLQIIAIYILVFIIGVWMMTPDFLSKLRLLFTSQDVLLQAKISDVAYLIAFVVTVNFINIRLIKSISLILPNHRHTRLIVAIICGSTCFIVLLCSTLLFHGDASFTIPMINAGIIFIISFTILFITSFWILYLHKKHIIFTPIQK